MPRVAVDAPEGVEATVTGGPLVDLAAERRAIDSALGAILDTLVTGIPEPVAEAIRYALEGHGKRLRGILVMHAYQAAGRGPIGADAVPLAAAVEIIHTYSLVHDDLPCMDDDSVRRGRPTTHMVHGVPIATAAGLAMVPLAARAVVQASREMGLPHGTEAIIVETLMHAAGAAGMIGGQLRDLRAEGEMQGAGLTLESLQTIHRTKTGTLIAASARIGGLAGGATPEQLDALARYGADLGLAFQIVDDVLDVTATTAQLGKSTGRDALLRKSTYPSLLGVDGAMTRARALVDDGCRSLDIAGLLTPELRHFADLVITRTN